MALIGNAVNSLWGPFNPRKAINHVRYPASVSLPGLKDRQLLITGYSSKVNAAKLDPLYAVPFTTHTLVLKRAKQLALRFANSHGADIKPRKLRSV